MREYEATFIFPEKEDSFAKGKELVEKEFSRIKGKILKTDDIGKRELAYTINKQDKGHYIFYNVELDPLKVTEIERNFRLSSDVLKYLFVKKEK
jgi:small subunit ribosomal protein S6